MALELASRFKNVTGIDPEDSMVAAGLQPESGNKIRYAKGTAEDLPAVGLGANSIDLAVAGEAAHYFTHENSWPQLAKALKPKGSIAWIIMSSLMDATLSPYWSEPGWSISEDARRQAPRPRGNGHALDTLIDEPKPTGDPDGAWDPSSALRCKSGTSAGKWYLKEHWTLAQVEKCLRSWSSVKRYQDKNPGDLDGEQPDVVSRVIAQLEPILGPEFNVAWPLVVQFIRRK
ncbi:hypothetical protein A1Q1_07785 [Trichosporon asahii var. asahii CBS 2479]|uniref:Methyltransferase type 11 domain-containing protein n=1 Tax=Trichosporon asahii var. asahii (strain ATCC 90039 / CBS 2479 / JCM 2466 / KCTC 7840 / NBRC 103889/ NCYC 2677 / UAMH 7654) TaxID=1186058 RepID=J5TI04_TRIAS|nr:hypothetical protein A1Q1_07785 [Trichosporon asahii var. asahii CBS 2479]EJT50991.1 hypothetical protein A1Q1_07785 [Trichosporon asahii var. asahii CBS 2479]